ncbi:natural cytotoxicity triggering receptor 2-like [Notamacropus eugenii]|uniref:natural cytotoxicity triggering receptor 2-like n=1 Tax=Notamacropus eugenii TaxID=9315 RepID=UPI003B6711D7
MMTPAAPLLLLPLLLIGSQEQEIHMKYQEGQTLRVSCSYKPQRYESRWKTWCKVREDGEVCERLITRSLDYTAEHRDLRASLKENTYSGTITITMSNLRVKDSGTYKCGIYSSVQNTIDIIRTIVVDVSPVMTLKTTKPFPSTSETPFTTSAIPLTTSSPPQSSIFYNSPVIQVLCGLIVTKGVVFTALVVLLVRCRGPGKESLELSQDQNDLK